MEITRNLKSKSKTVYSTTKDISANLKSLRRLERKGLIKVVKVKIENPTKKIKQEVLPTGVYGHTKWGECLYGSEEQAEIFEKIKGIVGPENIKDAIHLEAHIREGNDCFVTEDTHILSKKAELEKVFPGLKIRHTDDLVHEIESAGSCK